MRARARARGRGGDENLLPPMREALRARCTVGEICGVLREEWGTYDAQRARAVSDGRADHGRAGRRASAAASALVAELFRRRRGRSEGR